jgi:hypothetical protein
MLSRVGGVSRTDWFKVDAAGEDMAGGRRIRDWGERTDDPGVLLKEVLIDSYQV